MDNHLSAVVLDFSNKNHLVNLLRTEFQINQSKTVTSTNEALKAIEQLNDVTFIFIQYESTLDHTFEFVKSALATKKCENTKFVLLAEKSNKKFLMKAADNGISCFILKPFSKEKFISKVKKLLPKRIIKSENRINLLESVEAKLRYKGREIVGGIEDISAGGCMIRTPRLGRIGIEVYDIVTIRVEFENEKLGVNAEVIRMEKDQTENNKAIRIAFKFTKPNEENASQFAKLWAFILKERESV